jgi:2-keto-4-pentenoate hydratase/2-oxohepta-3-ene-1,7-dioic acid hydratase in catechol pathway
MNSTRPGKIVCIGRNFRDHARELGHAVPTEPVFFLKAPSALIGPGEAIRLPTWSREVHHEGEVALIIGRRATAVDEARALEHVAAWTVLNDVTARDVQRGDNGRFTRAKGFDTACPLSDVRLPTLDWARCRVQCLVDGALRQDGALVDLVFSPAFVISYVSRYMSLEPGDVVALGTPQGVGPLLPGEVVEVRLIGPDGELLCSLRNPVVAG